HYCPPSAPPRWLWRLAPRQTLPTLHPAAASREGSLPPLTAGATAARCGAISPAFSPIVRRGYPPPPIAAIARSPGDTVAPSPLPAPPAAGPTPVGGFRPHPDT